MAVGWQKKEEKRSVAGEVEVFLFLLLIISYSQRKDSWYWNLEFKELEFRIWNKRSFRCHND